LLPCIVRIAENSRRRRAYSNSDRIFWRAFRNTLSSSLVIIPTRRIWHFVTFAVRLPQRPSPLLCRDLCLPGRARKAKRRSLGKRRTRRVSPPLHPRSRWRIGYLGGWNASHRVNRCSRSTCTKRATFHRNCMYGMWLCFLPVGVSHRLGYLQPIVTVE